MGVRKKKTTTKQHRCPACQASTTSPLVVRELFGYPSCTTCGAVTSVRPSLAWATAQEALRRAKQSGADHASAERDMNETTSTFLRGESSRYHRDAQHFMEQAFLALQSEILVQVERAITDTIQSQQRDDGRLWMYGNELRKRIIDTIGKTPVVGNK